MSFAESSIMDLALTPLRAALSKPARRAYISTILFLSTSVVLFFLSIIAYVLFYLAYVPSLGFSAPLHLQFPPPAPNHHPFALYSIPAASLISTQDYDIHVTLTLPRSPTNLDAGNFMADLTLISQPPSSTPLHQSRRAAILTYTSPLINRLSLLTFSPLYILGFLHEKETIQVPMFERLVFPRGWRNLPASLRFELHAPSSFHPTSTNGPPAKEKKNLEVYDATIHFITRLRGLRWWMYNHRILSLLAFVITFYLTALASTAIAWAALTTYMPVRQGTDRKVKSETSAQDASNGEEVGDSSVKKEEVDDDESATDVDLSDTPRTFPAYSSRSTPLHYPPGGRTATSPEETTAATGSGTSLAGADEADDEEVDPAVEEELARVFGIHGLQRRPSEKDSRDSGIGTSLSESLASGSVAGLQRRRSGARR